ncbi:acyl-CoA thioesterase [Micromonospora chokoriensis]
MHDTTTIAGRAPSASHLTLSQIMDQHHTNLMGAVHGGQILNFIDSLTAAIDETAFLRAVRIGDVVHVDADHLGRAQSMEVAVKVTADRWDRAVPSTDVATAHLVMVAIDDDGQPRVVPPLLPETDGDRRGYREAEIRREHRLALRRALLDGAEEG